MDFQNSNRGTVIAMNESQKARLTEKRRRNPPRPHEIRRDWDAAILENKEYDIIKFRNGYAKDAPTMLVEYKGYTIGKEYELKLGKIIEVNYE